MKKTKVKIPAKINLTLDVFQGDNNFHNIESLVASINLFDAITLTKRKDNKVTFTNDGLDFFENDKDNNAVKCAKKVMEKYSLSGVDIKIERGIPIGAGLGSSSADIAGVLNAMQKLYGLEDLSPIASTLGSDVTYMMNGGFAVLSGKGDNVEKVNCNKRFYLVLMTASSGISAGASYKEFDRLGKESACATKKAKDYLNSGKYDEFINSLSNDLYLPSKNLVPEIEENINTLSSFGKAVMTGSGSCTYLIFENKKERNYAYKKLKAKFNEKIIKANII